VQKDLKRKGKLSRAKKSIINFFLSKIELSFFPSKCKLCGADLKAEERAICQKCESEFSQHDGPMCPVCGKFYFSLSARDVVCYDCLSENPPFEAHRSAGIYEGKLRETILLYKYRKIEYLAKPLAEFLARRLGDFCDVDCIVPLPSHKKRLKERGFDHILKIAKKLGRIMGIDVRKILVRNKYTLPQTGLSRSARLKNPKGSFSLIKDERYKRILVIDDVWTTGATIREAARVLKSAGYKVLAATVARDI